ncbi:ABC transporter substrate-binding protein [Croceicoccus sp. F390]|uniref:ABC transporter substrate-binding protein n=1 Tax=Croceicoccus esteveae TaxID=3075597 RepID=A0ABU2ZH54_9SPHN|nr:ABC transporter substrate-binding protein [Croceicoccus sp. F390]MDT0575937.1 ABC transporter substrate-binding protein [Croceicoccus sp. F390]
MRTAKILATLATLLPGSCGAAPQPHSGAAQRIVSLDYCADQYVLRFADRQDIFALSLDAQETFSCMGDRAEGIATVRPRTADVLALRPDLVVRSYGGGAEAAAFLHRAGVPVVQLGFPATIGDVREEVRRVGIRLGGPDRAQAIADQMDSRLAALPARSGKTTIALYMTPAGVTTGEGSLVHEMLLAAAFLEQTATQIDSWSAARHPVARAQLRDLPVAKLEEAWTSCGASFRRGAVEALAQQAAP